MTNPLDSELLRTFVAVVDAGSFTEAGQEIGRTQSAVSMQIKRLETIAGAKLLKRGPGGSEPTASGKKLLLHARTALLHLDRAATALDTGTLSGKLRIGVLAEYGATYLPKLLATFSQNHPEVEVAVTAAHSGILCQALDKGKLDLAIVLDKPGTSLGTTLMQDRTYWATSQMHDAHTRDILPVALFADGCWWRDWALESLTKMQRSHRIAYASESNVSLKSAIEAGLAVGILSEQMLPDTCRPLTSADGFPPPVNSKITLRKSERSTSREVNEMARAIKTVFRKIGGNFLQD